MSSVKLILYVLVQKSLHRPIMFSNKKIKLKYFLWHIFFFQLNSNFNKFLVSKEESQLFCIPVCSISIIEIKHVCNNWKNRSKFGFLLPYEFHQPSTKITKQSKNVGRFKNPNLSYKHILSERGIGSCWDFQYPIFC